MVIVTDKRTDASWDISEKSIWAGLGSRPVHEKKKFGGDYEQLLRAFFLCFQGQKKIFAIKNIKKRPQKLLIICPKLFFFMYWPAAQTSPEFFMS